MSSAEQATLSAPSSTHTRWPQPDSTTRYGSVSRLFHWGMAFWHRRKGASAVDNVMPRMLGHNPSR